MLLYPPRILRRCCYIRLEYYGDVAIPAKNTTEMFLYPPKILRRCCYTRLEYYGDVAIPA